MRHEFIIADASVKYMNARNPLEESLLYTAGSWTRDVNKATKYTDSNSAVTVAKTLYSEAPVKVLVLQLNGNQIVGIGDVKYHDGSFSL